MRWTVTPHIDGARVADEPKLRRPQRVSRFYSGDGGSVCRCNRHSHRHHGAGRVCLVGDSYMALFIKIAVAVIVNGRTVTMLGLIVMRGIRSMYVKGEALRLERKERESREADQAAPHKPESMEPWSARQSVPGQRPLTIGKTKTTENDQRLAPLGRPVAT